MIADSIQLNRRANLRLILEELTADGITGRQAQARSLHTGRRFLDDMLSGEHIPALFAREVEWVMHKRAGWMDEDGRENAPLCRIT